MFVIYSIINIICLSKLIIKINGKRNFIRRFINCSIKFEHDTLIVNVICIVSCKKFLEVRINIKK